MYNHNRFNPASPAQRACLAELGCPISGAISSDDANRIIKAVGDKWAILPPTEKQEYFLRLRGQWRPELTRKEATDLIGAIKRRESLEWGS